MVEADTSGVRKQRLRNAQGGFYFSQHYDIVLLFGLTEMKAYVSWMENVCFQLFRVLLCVNLS
jgi:hypothetical protein